MENWNEYSSPKRKKGKILLTHVMKAYRENRGITPLILNLRVKWMGVVKFTLRLAGNQRVSQSFGEEKSL